MTTIRRGRGLVLAGASTALFMAPLDAPAQDQPRESAGTSLEEVIVSARKREESVLDVPVAINVFTAADIEAAGIERPQDFIDLTPNMSLVQTQNQGTSFVTVRGISQARNSEPSVAVLIDGVLMVNPSQFNQELVDIESIQVLKGPQGALYGRNAIGGAIIINTRAAQRHLREQHHRRLRIRAGPAAARQRQRSNYGHIEISRGGLVFRNGRLYR